VDAAALSRALGVDVVPTVAVRRTGVPHLIEALGGPRRGRPLVEYPPEFERALAQALPLLPEGPFSARALAVMALAGDETLAAWLRERIGEEDLSRLEDLRQQLRRRFSEPLAYVVNQARLREAQRIAACATQRAQHKEPSGRPAARRLEELTTHRLWGIPLLLVVLYSVYLFVGVFGAGTLVDLLEEGLFGRIVSPAARAAAELWIPWAFLRDLLVGPYGVITMALAYALALILPIVTTFFLAFGILEDSGYLPRLAVLVNRLFKGMGLNGKAVLPMVLGLGCDTMATLTTRILETRKERLIAILLLALGVPCSAQLTVVLALLSGLSVWAVVIWASVVFGVIVLVGRLAARLLPGRGSDFVLELPPLRLPRPGNIAVKTLARVEWYLKEAVPLFVLGTVLLFVADRLHLLGFVERAAEPVVGGLLGLPREAAQAFVVGFLRRDFGAAGLFALQRQGNLDTVQALVATVTITLFLPCIANFFMIVKERGWRTGLAIAAFTFFFAIAVGAGLRAFLHVVPVF
jgi:ferrous iron transport protein B